MLREDISLEDLLKYGRTLETSDRQIATMEHTQQDVVVNKVYSGKSCFFCVVVILIPKEENPVRHAAKHVKTARKVATLRKFVAQRQPAIQKNTSNG